MVLSKLVELFNQITLAKKFPLKKKKNKWTAKRT